VLHCNPILVQLQHRHTGVLGIQSNQVTNLCSLAEEPQAPPQPTPETMELLLPLFRVVLFFVFALAGVMKARDRTATTQTLQSFGFPARLAPVLSVFLPLAELGTALALAWNPTAWYGALVALALLLLFTAGITWNLLHGRTPPCNCFGQMSPKPISKLTLLRNSVLAACAAVILLAGRNDVGPGVASLIAQVRIQPWLAPFVILIALLAACLLLLVQVVQQQGRMLVRLDALEAARVGEAEAPEPDQPKVAFAPGPPIYSDAPAFELQNLAAETVFLPELLSAGKDLVFVFMNPHCGPCTTLLDDVPRWMGLVRAGFSCVVLSEGPPEDIAAKYAALDPARVLILPDRSVPTLYHAWGTPSAILVTAAGKIGSRVAQGADSIRAMLNSLEQGVLLPAAYTSPSAPAVPAPSSPGALAIGEPMPPIDLPAVDRPTISLDQFKGRPLLLLFWNPACGFCTQMLHRLRAWEISATERSLQLLLISTGAHDDHHQMHLQAPIALDEHSTVATLLGAGGTPSAVVIDASGRIASPLAAGADAIFAMAGSWS